MAPLPAKPIDLSALYQEITAELRAIELRYAELRGQLALIERLVAESQDREKEENDA